MFLKCFTKFFLLAVNLKTHNCMVKYKSLSKNHAKCERTSSETEKFFSKKNFIPLYL